MASNICPVCGKEMDQWGYCFHHCHYCFKSLEKNEECDCGFEEKVRPPLTLREGATLDNGKYIIGAVLGKGGFGITYLGYQPGLKARVAIKEYFPSDFVTRGREGSRAWVVSQSNYYDSFLQKFKNEAVILEKFNHVPNIVQVKNLLQENNTAYIIMEYIEGKSLKAIIQENGGKLPWNTLHEMMDPVLDSLQRIHEGGVIHRDIAPDNIMVDKDGRPVLIDFGTARISSSDGASVPAGKEGYAPIEQMEGANSQDPRTDIYALGATYYKALTGVTPQNAKIRYGMDSIQPVNKMEPEVPKHVSAAIMKALSPNIDDRWHSVAEFREALNKPPKKKVNLLLILILLALLVLGAIAYFFFFPRYSEEMKMYLDDARNGDPAAQIWVGDAWFEGIGVRQNYKKGCEWYRQAAEQEDGQAEYMLANCYRDGKGVLQSDDDYRLWLSRAAYDEYPPAQYDFGKLFEDASNEVRAEYWYNKASENGYIGEKIP